MDNYEYKNRKINYVVVKELIIELFAGKNYKTLKVIREEVEQYHLSNGGIPGVNMNYAVSDKIKELVKEGRAQKDSKFKGEYRILHIGEVVPDQNEAKEFNFDAKDLDRLRNLSQELQDLLAKYEDSE